MSGNSINTGHYHRYEKFCIVKDLSAIYDDAGLMSGT